MNPIELQEDVQVIYADRIVQGRAVFWNGSTSNASQTGGANPMKLAVCRTIAMALAVAPWPAFAQEGEPTRSVGVSVSPRLAIHDESTCCSGIGAWLQIRRFQIDYSVAIDTWRFDRTVDGIDYFNELGYAPDAVPRRLSGHAMTVLFDLMTWNERRYAARFRIGGGYRVALDDVPFLRSREAELRRRHGIHLGPPVKHWGTIDVSLTFDFTVGKKGVVRAGLSSSLPFLEPEPRLGAGWRF